MNEKIWELRVARANINGRKEIRSDNREGSNKRYVRGRGKKDKESRLMVKCLVFFILNIVRN